MWYFVYKIKEVEEKTLSWGAQGKAKGLRVSIEDKIELKIITKINEQTNFGTSIKRNPVG